MIDLQQVIAHSPAYFSTYISLVPEGDILDILDAQIEETVAFFSGLPAEKQEYRYAEGKWTPKEILGHLIDCERIFQYRILCIARGDQTDLPGFEENDYVAGTDFNARSMDNLLAEFRALRTSGMHLFRSLSQNEYWHSGSANGMKNSVIGMMYSIAGHFVHHAGVVTDRYLRLS